MSDVRRIPVALTRELRQRVLRPHQTLEELAADEAPGTIAVGAFDGDELVGVGIVTPMPMPEGWQVRGMAVADGHRGRGLGTRVLAELLDAAAIGGATRAWCNARTPARSLYERAGFAVESEEFEVPPIGPHYVMARALTGSAS